MSSPGRFPFRSDSGRPGSFETRRAMTTIFELCEQEARAGMARAMNHAESESPGWAETAYAFLREFAARATDGFISEDVSDASKRAGMAQPPTDRAWGAVYRRALAAGVIVRDGSGRSRRRHGSICPKWRKP